VTCLQQPDAILSVSIVKAGGASGATAWVWDVDQGTLDDLDALISRLLAGRAAEEIACGEPSGGAGGSIGSDLAAATILAVCAEASWGLGDRLCWHGAVGPETVGAFLAAHPDIRARTEARLRGALERARTVLERSREQLDAIASRLLERGVMSGDEVREIAAATGAIQARRGAQ